MAALLHFELRIEDASSSGVVDALYKGSPALATYYVVTDDEPQDFWKILNQAIVSMGFTDLYSKFCCHKSSVGEPVSGISSSPRYVFLMETS